MPSRLSASPALMRLATQFFVLCPIPLAEVKKKVIQMTPIVMKRYNTMKDLQGLLAIADSLGCKAEAAELAAIQKRQSQPTEDICEIHFGDEF